MKSLEHWNTEQVKQHNRSLVLKMIYKNGPISKADISKNTNLTFATIGNITAELLKIKALKVAGYGESNGGRKPVLYEFNWENYYVIALDIGVTKVSAGLVNFKGVIYERYSISMTDFNYQTTFIEKVYKVIDQLLSETKIEISKIAGIGVSAPGPIDEDGSQILSPPNLQGVENVNLKDQLQQRYNLIIILEKDANAAALAEQWFGEVNKNENILYIFADQGIGGGMIVDSRTYRGFKNGAGEIGHISIDPDGPRCNCGNFGCLEAVASGLSIITRIKKEIRRGGRSSLTDLYLNDEDALTLETIMEHGENGDELVLKVLEETGRYLGIGVTNAINFFAPKMVIFGGQLVELYPEIVQISENIAKSRAFSSSAKDIKFVKSSFGECSGLMGAASIIQQLLFDSPGNTLIKL
ncbi:ROK family protein [Virgibacillus halodenitrificans]|uniref:ROK family protein n=1 Tax=Virgibacillus halodenitrificans TaxID=1482 RepID=UPI0024C043B0|nr:ROK family protein [Virgibacillus halodenitrificans]WHX26259.1 ROK family protein [Virgibacillus halodenitrificans]